MLLFMYGFILAVGLWFGATPETLLNTSGATIRNNVFGRNSSF